MHPVLVECRVEQIAGLYRNGHSGHGQAGLFGLDGYEGELCKSLND